MLSTHIAVDQLSAALTNFNDDPVKSLETLVAVSNTLTENPPHRIVRLMYAIRHKATTLILADSLSNLEEARLANQKLAKTLKRRGWRNLVIGAVVGVIVTACVMRE